jgi:type I restriction enzyme M protein
LGRDYTQRNEKLCTIITQIAEGIADSPNDSDALGDAYEYLIGQFAAGGGLLCVRANSATLRHKYSGLIT